MSVRLRPVTPTDHDLVLRLNEAHVEMLAPMDPHRLGQLIDFGADLRIIEVDDEAAGFVVTFAAGSDYDSRYYGFHAERLTRFTYLDRIVVDESVRRRGVASAVYDEIEATADSVLALEVNLRPRNDASLAFHSGRGFVVVGELADDDKAVAMMVKQVD